MTTPALHQTYSLADGSTIPRLGLGTWLIDDAVVADAVRGAIEVGYRNIDTAQAYGNERGVGEGVRTSGVPREDLFVSSKLAAEIKTHDGAVEAIDGTLERMGLDYVDLMLIHSPQPWSDFRGGDYSEGNRQAWRALEDAQLDGRIRSIGVSNFTPADLEPILSDARVQPQVDQILLHVGNTPHDLLGWCREHDILVEAYSPIGHGAVMRSEQIVEVAQRYGVSVPQLCIRYALQLGTVPLPKTADPAHMRANAEVDFEISDADMAVLAAIDFKQYGDDARFPVFSGR
ncbi:aldo/keto reductase [Acidipropionibacterium timonense]|uniref:aldo/keto reductase n=1 Tax=Acidipropionibacterium timonense TaxID=2161818 RepID=UPI00102FDFDB|nr:aldo/keto reductase [Acidipropionibacterium timonense]